MAKTKQQHKSDVLTNLLGRVPSNDELANAETDILVQQKVTNLLLGLS